jgi:hypothetical protein
LTKTYCDTPHLRLALKMALRLPGARDFVRKGLTRITKELPRSEER